MSAALFFEVALLALFGALALVCAVVFVAALWAFLYVVWYFLRKALPRRINRKPLYVWDYPVCMYKWPDADGYCTAPGAIHVDGKAYCNGHAPAKAKRRYRNIILKETP